MYENKTQKIVYDILVLNSKHHQIRIKTYVCVCVCVCVTACVCVILHSARNYLMRRGDNL